MMRRQERRQKPRAPLPTEVTIQVGHNRAQALLQDISLGGLALICPYRCTLGSRVTVFFELPTHTEPVCAHAEVVRCLVSRERCSWGLRFIQLHPKQAASIERFVRGYLVEMAHQRHQQASQRSIPNRKRQKAVAPAPRPAPADRPARNDNESAYQVKVQDLDQLFAQAIHFVDN